LYFVRRDSKLGEAMLLLNKLTSARGRLSVYVPPLPVQNTRPSRRIGWLGWLSVALLAGYLLFAHGCHGEEKDDLVLRSIKDSGPQSPLASARTHWIG
jgi:hypothetical protein